MAKKGPFKKSDLRTGMMVECANGSVYMALLDTCMGMYPNVLTNVAGYGFVDLEHYDDDLVCRGAPEFSITKVYNPIVPSGWHKHTSGELIWERV